MCQVYSLYPQVDLYLWVFGRVVVGWGLRSFDDDGFYAIHMKDLDMFDAIFWATHVRRV